jgi:hypothetical protein
MHPLAVISHNNHFYVRNTIEQATKYGMRTIVVDNASSYEDTCVFLKEIEADIEVIRLPDNLGSECWRRLEIYEALPTRFFLTDPDLQWNPQIPTDFPRILDELCTQHTARKIGFALDLSDRDLMFQDGDYYEGKTIWDWETPFWTRRVPHATWELYAAVIDTTFHLFDKAGSHDVQLRVAGDFTAKHLPWYRDTSIPPHDLVHMYMRHGAPYSTTARLVLREMARKDARWEPCDGCRHLLPPAKT